MKFITMVFGFAAPAAAHFNYDDWRAPAPGDLRSPCPALNSLANHGLLPRDGRNVTQAALLKATAAVNLSADITIGLFSAALKTSSDPASGVFTLGDLKKHNFIEHDGSLSRADVGTPGAGDQELNAEVFSEYKSFFGDATQITVALAAAARWGRVKSAHKTNPNFIYGPTQRFNSYAETAILFQVLANPRTGIVPLNWLEVLFCEERLPVREGWKPPTVMAALPTAGLLLQLAMTTDEKNADLVLPLSKRAPSSFSHVGEVVL